MTAQADVLVVAPNALGPVNGFAVRVHALARELSKSFSVVYSPIVFSRNGDGAGSLQAADPYRVAAVDAVPRASTLPLVGRIPASAAPYCGPSVAAALRELAERTHPQVIVAHSALVMPGLLASTDCPIVLDLTSVDSLIFRRRIGATPGLAKVRAAAVWLKFERFERAMVRRAAVTTVVSSTDLAYAQRLVPAHTRWAVVENGVDTDFYRFTPNGGAAVQILYTGVLGYASNFSDLAWFLRGAYPRILAAIPQARLTATGSLEGVDLNGLPSKPGVTFAGLVPDLRPVYAASSVCIAPTRVGAGTRLKILEAMASGVPVVATPQGVEGLEVEEGRHCLVRSGAAEFADAVVGLLNNASARQEMAQQARALVERRYTWKEIGRRFVEVVAAARTGS